jgi:hypothetical protein
VNGEDDVTAVGAHDVVADPAVPLHPEVSPTAQISRTSTEYVVFAIKPEKEAVLPVPELYI